MTAPASRSIRHTQAFPCPICGGYASLHKGRGIRCAGMTGEHLIWCSREERAGKALLDLNTSPPTFRHHRHGWCPCGTEHEHRLPSPVFPSFLRLVVDEAPTEDDLSLRHDVYEYTLSLLDLRPDARADLTRRGLSEADIDSVGYRSVPASYAERKVLIAKLVAKFGEERLRRVPGFVDKNGHLFFWVKDGYVVPYRDERRRITGVQLKSLLYGGYITAIHSHVADLYHVAGPIRPGCDLYVTEGGLKGQVSAVLGNVATFGIPGQSLTAAHIEAIKRLAPGRVITALDQEQNKQTDQARERWPKLMFLAGLTPYLAVWEGNDLGGQKGLDDLLFAGKRPRVRAVTITPPEISARRVPRPTKERGAVPAGMSLPEGREVTRSAIRGFLRYQALPGYHARSLVVRTPPGTGKTTAVGESLDPRTPARIVVGTRELAAELAAEHGYGLIKGRNTENCERFDVVAALAAGGHPIQALACGTVFKPRCPHRHSCPYWEQFDREGPLVGTAEQLYNPTFLRGATVVIVDDADLSRAMIERRTVKREMIGRAVNRLADRDPSGAPRRLLMIVQHAMVGIPVFPAVQGPAVWDHLVRVGKQEGHDLVALIQELPNKVIIPQPEEDADGYISAETVEQAVPAVVGRLLEALRDELPSFLTNEDFNCCLRLDAEEVELACLREPATEPSGEDEGRVYLDSLPLLITDATPIDTLVDRLTMNHERLPDVDVVITLPDVVDVVQCAVRTNGHMVLKDDERAGTVMAEIGEMRRRYPVGDPWLEAAIGFKDHRAGIEGIGLARDRVLTFGSSRGTNALKEVQRLHIVGRPMPPPSEMAYLAQVVHHGEAPISSQLKLSPRSYGGQPFEVDVVDFVDPRPAELLRAHREDELVQVLQRARLSAVGVGDDPRQEAQVILHTSHPVPGLRVDDLNAEWSRTNVNTKRADAAAERIRRAEEELRAEGREPSKAEVARRAHANQGTVAKYFGTPLHTPQKESLDGVERSPKTESETLAQSPPTEITGPRATPTLASMGMVPCPSGCGWFVRLGEKCRDCVEWPEDAGEEILIWVG